MRWAHSVFSQGLMEQAWHQNVLRAHLHLVNDAVLARESGSR